MKKKSNLKSICCNKEVRVEGMNDFNKQCTMYHVCTYCNKPCDVTVKVRKIWTINPSTKVIPNKKKDKYIKEEDFDE
jgi:hypothetical protein